MADSANDKIHSLVTDNIDVWTNAIKKRNATGRGSNKKIELTGIKKLRELILELAVRGKLVPQNSNDEPASVLLERIAFEKMQLVKDKKIKKTKALSKIDESEKVFKLPRGWEWSKLGSLSIDIHYGYTASAKHNCDGIRLLRITDIQDDKVDWSTVPSCEIESEKAKNYLLENDDILIARTGGTIGKSYLVAQIDLKAVFASYLIRVRKIESIYAPYTKVYLGSQLYWGQLYENSAGTGQPNVNATALKSLLFPIAPLAEQHRIVAKVDELMALCDQLESQTENSLSAHQTLVEVLLSTLTSSADAKEFQSNWARIAEHFDTLFTTEHAIDQLKQTILQLAVMGKLVPQNPNDEPASKLLDRITAEKAQLIADKIIKKQKTLPAISENEKPFELPNGWAVCNLSSLIPQFQNGASSRGDKSGQDVIVLRLADIKNWQVSLQDTRSIQIQEKSIARYSLEKGDVLIIRVNGSADIVGRFITCHENFDAIYCDHFIRMRFPIECFSPAYLGLLGSSALIRNRISNLFISTAGQKTVNQSHINSLIVSLPPLSEQERIVAKANQLMTLCEQLKTLVSDAQSIQVTIAETLVEQAVK